LDKWTLYSNRRYYTISMADNVNIIVQDTINDIVVNAAVIVETIDINVQAAVDEVQIIANPNNYVVNINRIIGEQVQSDWDQADDQAPDYIKNKPSIPTLTSYLTNDGEDGINPFITAADVPASLLVALPFTTDHLTATNNAYVVGDVVWYLGNVYRCIANNDSILPTSTTYWTNLGAGNPLVAQPSDWNATSGNNQILNKPTIPAAGVTSVGLTMPSAFSVANSPITSAGTLEVTGAGLVSQYVRGDGSLANFPTSTGGGSSLAFYLNGSVSQGTFGGVAFKEMDRTPILGAGTDFTISSNGYIQSFITDANVPNLLEIPAGNWNFETYFSASSNGGSPSFYVELYKWDGTTLSLIASNSANPEGITNGTATDLYLSALAVPQTTLALTDRLAVRIYVNNSGRTIKLHTENGHLCEVITTFSTGLTALNGLTAQVQSFATGTSGTDFAISSTTATHTFNLPTASAANRGALSSTDWSTFNGKFTLPALTSGSVLFSNGTTIAQDNSNLFWDDTNNRLGIGTATPAYVLDVNGTSRFSDALNFTNFSSLTPQGTTAADKRIIIRGGEGGAVGSTSLITLTTNANINSTSGNPVLVNISRDFAPTSGTATYTLASITGVINQTGGANGITRGLYIAPTLTAAADFRAIENSVGKVCLNTTSGNTMIGTSTDAGFKLDVNGTARVQNTLTIKAPGALSTDIAFKIRNSADTLDLVTVNGLGTLTGKGFIGTYFYAGTTYYDNARIYIGSTSNAKFQTFTSGFSIEQGTLTTIQPSAIFELKSTTQGFLPPKMTTTEKNAIATPAAGLVVYDTTLGKLCVRGAAAWETITSI
jgi:hypothetical protein